MNGSLRMIIRRIGAAVYGLSSHLAAGRHDLHRREDLYSSMENKEEFLESLRNAGGERKRVVHEVGPLASSDGTSWDEERIVYWDRERAIQNVIEHRHTRRCDCGAILAYENHILGTCMVCGGIVCQSEGCANRCEYCGSLVCGRHAIKYGEHTFCSRHRLIAWWRLFWGYM